MTASRRLAAVLAADMAGYSGLMGADEEGRLERLKTLRREFLDPKSFCCEVAMATENKEQVLVAMEGDISNFEKLIKLAKGCGLKTILAAMSRDLKRAEAESAEILALASVDGETRERLAADYGRLRRLQ